MTGPTIPHGSLRPRPIRTLVVEAPRRDEFPTWPPRWGAADRMLSEAEERHRRLTDAAEAQPPDSGRRAWLRHLAGRARTEWLLLVRAWRQVTDTTFGEDMLP